MTSAKGFRNLVIKSMKLTDRQKELLPAGFQRIGHVVILNLKPGISNLANEIAGLILKAYPYVKTVCLTQGVSGELREPRVSYLAGERKTETTHRENRCLFRLDVARIMFSKGNLSERARLPRLVRPGEVIADLFSGIGYFSIPIAKHARPRRIYSIEKNPTAFRYLKENIRLNRVQDRMTPILGDCRKVLMGNVADRVIMGYLPKTYQYLPAAFEALRPEGGTIHYHDTFADKELWDKPLDLLEAQAFRQGYTPKRVTHKAIVKEYAPGVFHAVVDAEFSAR
jgi:tRNA wybutosine-synthesizing protein 2